MNGGKRLVDHLAGTAVAVVGFALLCAWPFVGVHPCAWSDTAAAAGLLPADGVVPGLGVFLLRLLFSLLPFDTALAASTLLAKALTGACGFLAYGIFLRMMGLIPASGARDLRRRRLAARLAAAVAAFAFVCSEPMWQAAQGLTGPTFVIFLTVLSSWLFTRFMTCPTYPTAVATLATLGVLCAETPFGWGLLAFFAFLAVRRAVDARSGPWVDFLNPFKMQKAKWSMTYVFIGVFVGSVLLELLSFVLLDGLRAEGLTAVALPAVYVKAYFCRIVGAADFPTLGLGLFATIIPTVLSFLLVRSAADEDQYLLFKHSVLFFLCALVAFSQLAPFPVAWFWDQSGLDAISRPLVLLAVFFDAAVLAWGLFVLCVEALCRDYRHVESVFYQGYQDREESDRDERVRRTGDAVVSVRLTPGRLAFLLLPVVIVAISIRGRCLSEDRQLQVILQKAVEETVTEAVGARYLFTDGALDAPVRIEAKRRGLDVSPVSVLGGTTPREAYVRQLGAEGAEDRATLATGAAEALRTWTAAKSPRLAEVAAQVAFEFFRLDDRLRPTVYGLLVRPAGGDAAAAAESVERCRRLVDSIVDAHATGVWRHAKDRWLKDRILFVQFRLAVMCRLRAAVLDVEGRTKEASAEIASADRLNASNPSLCGILRAMDWMRRQGGADLTPREGLALATKRLDFAMARRYAQPILHADPDDPDANFAVGMGYYVEQQFALAEEHLLRVLKRKPNEPAVHNNLALVCLKTDHLEDAERYLARALELEPNQQEILDTKRQFEKAKSERPAPPRRKPRKETKK